MDNYYRELHVDPTATNEQIKKAILKERRHWSNRTNLPDLETRQEAERQVALLATAEQILLDPVRRQQYDQALRTAPVSQPQQTGPASTGDGHDWVREGRRFLSAGDLPNALYAANQATGLDGKNPDAWALSAQAKYRWGKIPDAIYEYKRAIDLRPNEAKFYFDLGGVFESVEDWPNALQQYRWASRIDPMSTVYRASIGEVLYQLDEYDEAIAVLLQCVAEAPENHVYKNYLAMAYCIGAYENWTYIPPNHPSGVPEGHYATTKLQVDEALAAVQKAQALQLQDPEVQDQVHRIQYNMQTMLKRQFHGNWIAAGFATLIGLFSLSGNIFWGMFWLACGIGYAISCFIPQYIVNRRIVKGQALSANSFLVSIFVEGGVGCTGMIIGLVLIMLTLPIVTVVNFTRNWVLASQPTADEKARLARMTPPMQPSQVYPPQLQMPPQGQPSQVYPPQPQMYPPPQGQPSQAYPPQPQMYPPQPQGQPSQVLYPPQPQMYPPQPQGQPSQVYPSQSQVQQPEQTEQPQQIMPEIIINQNQNP